MSAPSSKITLENEKRLPTIAQALAEGEAQLANRANPSARLDAEVLLARIFGHDRTHLFTHYDGPLSGEQYRAYGAALTRRRTEEPIQYITGVREFWGLEFQVTRDVLIPRPETEHIVEQALELLQRPGAAPQPTLVDAGAGSGCLAIALAKEWPCARIIATDISAPALRVARANAVWHGVDQRIDLLQADWLTALRPRQTGIDMIVCNPPYIAYSEFQSLPSEVREFEPRHALTDEADGLRHYRRLIPEALALLAAGGHLIFELSTGRAEAVKELFDKTHWEIRRVVRDLQGIDRCLVARKRE